MTLADAALEPLAFRAAYAPSLSPECEGTCDNGSAGVLVVRHERELEVSRDDGEVACRRRAGGVGGTCGGGSEGSAASEEGDDESEGAEVMVKFLCRLIEMGAHSEVSQLSRVLFTEAQRRRIQVRGSRLRSYV